MHPKVAHMFHFWFIKKRERESYFFFLKKFELQTKFKLSF